MSELRIFLGLLSFSVDGLPSTKANICFYISTFQTSLPRFKSPLLFIESVNPINLQSNADSHREWTSARL